MFNSKILSEGITDVVYHFTSLENFLSIVKDNEFILRPSNLTKTSEYNDNGYYYYFSTTRGKNSNEGYGNTFEGTVRITLDGRKLSQKYKGQPFDYWGPSWEKNTQNHEYDEMEDRILSNEPVIKNAIDYILRVDIFFGMNQRIVDIKKRIENAKQQGKTQIVSSLEHRLYDEERRCQNERKAIKTIYNYLANKRKDSCLYIYTSEKDFSNQSNNFDDSGDIITDYNIEVPVINDRKYLFAASMFVALITMGERKESDEDIAKIYKMLGYEEYLNGTEIRRVKYNLRQGLDYIVQNIFNSESSSDPKFSKMTGSFIKYLRAHKFKNLNQFIEFIKYANTQQYMAVNETLLKGDKVSDYIKRMIINNSVYSREQLSTSINELSTDMRQMLHDSAPSIYDACSRNNQNLLAYLRLYFLSYFDISHGKGPLEYALGLARIAIGEKGMFKGQNNDSDLSRLKVCVLFLHNSNDQQLKSQFDSNLNGLNYNELVRQLNDARKEFNKKNRETLSQMKVDASEYTIVPISSYEEASKYGQYTTWCVTQEDNHFQAYIKGGRRFYFCLKNGYENVVKQKGEGCPLDEYGLSMISVLVDSDGEPNYITTRWNHENDGENNENLKTAEQMQRITGINFYKTFKPYSLEELQAMGITPFYIVQDLLDQGVNPHDIFENMDDFQNNLIRVKLNKRYNLLYKKSNKLLIPNQWFDFLDNFIEGYSVISLNGKYNFIDMKGNLLSSNLWFDDACIFFYGYAQVSINNKWNYIDTQGNLLSPNQWFDYAFSFDGSTAPIRLDNKYNIIDTNGKLVFPNLWFDDIYTSYHLKSNILYKVQLNNKDYVIDKDLKLHIDNNINENHINISKSDIKNMVLECVCRILSEKVKKYRDSSIYGWKEMEKDYKENGVSKHNLKLLRKSYNQYGEECAKRKEIPNGIGFHLWTGDKDVKSCEQGKGNRFPDYVD